MFWYAICMKVHKQDHYVIKKTQQKAIWRISFGDYFPSNIQHIFISSAQQSVSSFQSAHKYDGR